MRTDEMKEGHSVRSAWHGEGKVISRTDCSAKVLFDSGEIITYRSNNDTEDDKIIIHKDKTKSIFDFIMSKLFKDKK